MLSFQHLLSDLGFYLFEGNPIISWVSVELLFLMLFLWGTFNKNEILLFSFFLLYVSLTNTSLTLNPFF